MKLWSRCGRKNGKAGNANPGFLAEFDVIGLGEWCDNCLHVVHILIGGVHVWIQFCGWCLSDSDRVAGDLCPYGLYPQDERDDPPLGTNRGQHKQIRV